MSFLQQTLALAKKDLIIILRRRWISTLIRALIFPVVFTVVIAYIKNWTAPTGSYGVGAPAPIRSLSDALGAGSASRNRFVFLVDDAKNNGDIGHVINQISSSVRNSGKQVVFGTQESELTRLCPSSAGGVSTCFAAVHFLASPDHPGINNSAHWNYTVFTDSSVYENVDIDSQNNGLQVYTLPLQRAIDSEIAATRGQTLPSISQYAFTSQTAEQVKESANEEFQGLILFILGFAYFVGLSSSIYHITGHICTQRESKMLQLIDAMMGNKSAWHAIGARVLAAHLVFDLVYLPAWIIMGAVLPTVVFPHTSPGWFVLLYVLTGLSLNSYSILVSSFFKKVALSGSVAIILALCLAIAANIGISDYEGVNDGAVYALAILFPPSTFVFFLMQTASWEIEGQGLNVNLGGPGLENWHVPAGNLLACLLFPLVLYPIIAVVVEKYMWGTSSAARILTDSEKMGGVAVRINNYTKTFKSLTDKKQTVTAVNDLSLDIHAGSITVLLGANGSGKSTTLNTIAGVETIKNGSIEIDGTGGLGFCPQQNVLYPLLSVREHIVFFEALKNSTKLSKAERKAEVERIIAGCDLTIKQDAVAKTLSGGQKRKLQLAMMLAGGSRVCCIDEASSGIDPIARRKVWDILRAERGRRTLLFTTHFLDEAEGLSDHVAILSKGNLKAQGSVAALKSELGGGYQVIMQDDARNANIPLPAGVKRESDYNRTVYHMPDSAVLAEVVQTLERNNIQSYRIEGPTVEKVFLNLSEEMRDSKLAQELRMAEDEAVTPTNSETASNRSGPKRALNLTSGKTLGPVQQTRVMLMKRLVVLKHNYMPYVFALLVTLVVAGLLTRFFTGPPHVPYPNGYPCQDPSNNIRGPYTQAANKASFGSYTSRYGDSPSEFIYGPPSRLSASQFMAALPNDTRSYYYSTHPPEYYQNVSNSKSVDTLQAFNDYVRDNKKELYFGGLYNDTSGVVIAWPVGSFYNSEYPAQLQAVANGRAINDTINFAQGSFAPSFTSGDATGTIIALLMTLGFSIYPGFFSLYITGERLRGVRQMHYSNGILSSSLWAGHAIFDLLFVLLISVLTIAIWVSQWTGWYAPGYMFVVFFLYGLAGTAFSYIVSLFVTSQLAAFAFSAIIQVIISMLYFVGYLLTTINTAPDQIYSTFDKIHYTIALICPAASLERALFMTLNQYSLACDGDHYASYPGQMRIYGAPILYLTLQFIIFCAFLMFWEGGRTLEVFGIRSRGSKKTTPKDPEKSAALRTQNPDAIESDARLSVTNLGLRVENVSKTFGSNTAVDAATFGILPSEKFALLGPNGAGKSTMISLIRGDLQPDHSSDGLAIHIGGDNIRTTPMAARAHLGVCPQFDSIDSMTLREHLRFYARARGVPDREANINELIHRLGLTEHADKMARKLSGGTKRKLSLAIALVANPSVLLLDEPSSGMDPAAKRALWSTLSAIAEGRVLLMTTHSMEEADALCDRAGIMASRMLALGNMEELRHRHGNAAFVHLVHKDAPHTTTEQMAAMNQWVEATFPNAIVEQRNFGGQMRFSVPQAKVDNVEINTGKLFRLIEHVKQNIGVADYSIGPATMDQVFLNVVEKHNVQEENTERQKKDAKSWIKRILRKY